MSSDESKKEHVRDAKWEAAGTLPLALMKRGVNLPRLKAQVLRTE